MKKQKHTPGPWRVFRWQRENYADGFAWAIADSRNHALLEFCQKGENAKTLANADLIAKAPLIPELVAATRKAIASGPMKIEPTPETFESIEMLPDNTMVDFRMSVATYKIIKTAIAKAEKP